MGERGHWTTELVWCEECRKVLADYFIGSDAWPYMAAGMPSLRGGDYGIFAGLVQGMYPEEEVHIFEGEVTDVLEARLCHPVTFWVFAEAAFDGMPVSVTINPVEVGIATDG